MMRFHRVMAAVAAAALLLPVIPVFAADPAAESEISTISHDVAAYTGAASVIAMIGAGFDVTHPVFAEDPATPAVTREEAEALLPGAYHSDKLPAVWDYGDDDADVSTPSFSGTAAAALAAGHYTGQGDIVGEDNTVTRDASYYGAAPDAQLLLFKATVGESLRIDADAAAAAILDAIALGADAIWLDTAGLNVNDALRAAFRAANESGTPVMIGAGDVSGEYITLEQIPAVYTDRGTTSAIASEAGVIAVGAAADPYADVSSFIMTTADGETREIEYVDTTSEYFDDSFAALFAGESLSLVAVPGLGKMEDYEGIDVTGAIAVVMRGEISFSEKAKNAAAAGALAFIVVDNGSGLSRMSLEDAPIPGVMISAAAGEAIFAAGAATFSVEALATGPASFSATGITGDLDATPSFLCAGQKVLTAIPEDAMDGALYALVSGTKFAAAGGAGYVARAAEYIREAGLSRGMAIQAVMAAAEPIYDETGALLSVREVGGGLVSGRGDYGACLLTSDTGVVYLAGEATSSSFYFDVRITNTTSERKEYTLSVSAWAESATEDGMLTGTMEQASGVRAYVGDSYMNVCTADGATNAARLALEPGASALIPLRISYPDSLRRDRAAIFYNGFFVDGVVTVTEVSGGSTTAMPYTVFYGEWESAPLTDASIYAGETPILAPATLNVYWVEDEETEVLLPLGAKNPYTTDTEYDEAYNLVNPAFLRYGWVELELYALREIDRVDITFYDADRHEICSRTVEGVDKAWKTGGVVIPLWDFIAMDNEDYLFPDGEYSCEVRLYTSFGQAGDAVQYMGFTFTLDSEAPNASDVALYREGESVMMEVRLTDNEALLNVVVYDTDFSYSAEGQSEIAGERDVTLHFDVTQYDGLSPLYIEVTDRAGSYYVARLTPSGFAALLAAYDEAAAEADESDGIAEGEGSDEIEGSDEVDDDADASDDADGAAA